jgi:hypothetical protein
LNIQKNTGSRDNCENSPADLEILHNIFFKLQLHCKNVLTEKTNKGAKMEQQNLDTNQIKILDKEAFDYIRIEKINHKRTYDKIAVDLNGLGYTHHIGRPLTGLDVSIFCTENGFRCTKNYIKRNRKPKKVQSVLLKNNSNTMREFEQFIQPKQSPEKHPIFSPAAELAAKIVDDISIAKKDKLTMLSKLV